MAQSSIASNTEAPAMSYDVNESLLYDAIERKDAEKLAQLGSLQGLRSALCTDFEEGISADSVEARRRQFGINELEKKKPVTFLELLADAFGDRIVQLLCVAAVISIIFGMTLKNPHTGKVERSTGWIEGTAIVISVSLVTLTGSINNYKKAKKFEELERETATREVQVIRDGSEITLMSNLLVVGDIMRFDIGDQFRCDGLFVDGQDVKVNESAMTGESDLIEKGEGKDFFLLSGTFVQEGVGKMLVVAVGANSYEGRMKKDEEDGDGETPLQEKLADLADDIGIFGFIGAIILFVALSIKEGILIAKDEREASATNFLNFVIVAVTLIVVAIPEGLPLAVTISLAWSMSAMMDDKCQVRVLASCETMGAATAVCSDKTGTLTTNIMTVVQGLLCEQEFVIAGYGIKQRNDDVPVLDRSTMNLNLSPELSRRISFSIAVNCSARQAIINNLLVWIGNKTEHGLLGFVDRLGAHHPTPYSYADLQESAKALDSGERAVRQFPFNSDKKRMTTIVNEDGKVTAHVKGASELILADCTHFLDRTGNVVMFNEDRILLYNQIIEDMASQGNRTMAMAYCDLPAMTEHEPEPPLIFIGVVGIQDPIRPEVPNAVRQCHSAGLTVRMVTGDNISTALAIAKKCNIYDENGIDSAMTGEEFRKLMEKDREAMLQLLPHLRVLARSSPHDKFLLVEALQELGDVVGVTGDGTNDAPALKLSDVGFAMFSGTDIAKGKSDMVLLDDNFATVVKAIRWGRCVNDNIRKFIQFQLTINLAGVLLTIIGSLASEESKEPFTPVQLLWVNLIMDTLGALALATESPEDACLQRPPVYKQAPLISRRMWAFILVHGTFQMVLLLVLLLFGHKWFNTIEDPDKCDKTWQLLTSTVVNETDNSTYTTMVKSEAQIDCEEKCTHTGGVYNEGNHRCQQGTLHSTIIFNTFIWMQIFNIFNARKIYDEINPFEGTISRSKNLVKVFGFILIFQVIAVELLGFFMETERLNWWQWLICVGLGVLELPLGYVPRIIPVKEEIPEAIRDKREREERIKEDRRKEMELKMAASSTVFVPNKDPALRRRSRSLSVTKRS